jgi:hypothetical protein
MPNNLTTAIHFLETQWSSINDNKIKGILAELRFKSFLVQNNIHFVSGGWIVIPGNPTLNNIPTREKVCILPRFHSFSWVQGNAPYQQAVTPAEISAYNYFRQVGVRAIFSQPTGVNEDLFALPTRTLGRTRAKYPRPYQLDFFEIAPNGTFISVPISAIFQNFPLRIGNKGMRCNVLNRINSNVFPWNTSSITAELFWFEYSRYYIQTQYIISNNDLDLFVIGPSGAAYPVEIKSKTPANDKALGDWFGIDMGPFAKLSFFTANAMNTDALYVVEEVDAGRNHVGWYGIRFTVLVKSCSWVGQGGGTGMMGGASTTYKIPKTAFTILNNLIQTL